MAIEQKVETLSFEAAGDLSSNQYHFVSVDSNGRVALTGDGAEVDGVLQNKPAALGRAAEVAVAVGKIKVKAGGTVTRGGDVASDSTGRAVDATSGDSLAGVALETATTAGQIITILLKPKAATL